MIRSKLSGTYRYVLPSDYEQGQSMRPMDRVLGEDILGEQAKKFMMRRVVDCLWNMEIVLHMTLDWTSRISSITDLIPPKTIARMVLGLYEEVGFSYRDAFFGFGHWGGPKIEDRVRIEALGDLPVHEQSNGPVSDFHRLTSLQKLDLLEARGQGVYLALLDQSGIWEDEVFLSIVRRYLYTILEIKDHYLKTMSSANCWVISSRMWKIFEDMGDSIDSMPLNTLFLRARGDRV